MSQLPDWARRGRARWRWTGAERPPFAVVPGPGQESVWDYPRPPAALRDGREVVVRRGERILARSTRTFRVVETSGPPIYYIPPEDVDESQLSRGTGSSRCEWKGEACYWTVSGGEPPLERAAWSYPTPFDEYALLRAHLAFYPAHLQCTVAGIPVRPQSGGFYGGWVTPELVGPFKGEPGSEDW